MVQVIDDEIFFRRAARVTFDPHFIDVDFHATEATKYIDDLTTMRTIIDAFATMNANQSWTVVGSDLTVGSDENEARLYSYLSKDIVSAVGWTQ